MKTVSARDEAYSQHPERLIALPRRRIPPLGRRINAFDGGPKSFLETCVMPGTVFCVVNLFSFLEADFELRDVLSSQQGGHTDKEFILAVLNLNVQLFHEQGYYDNTVGASRDISAT